MPVTRGVDVVERLIEIAIPRPEPPTPPPTPETPRRSEHRTSAAPKAEPKPLRLAPPGPLAGEQYAEEILKSRQGFKEKEEYDLGDPGF